jgi:UDP-glucose:(heptosyl)LPS alpha-1,3-glucosyltransferase
VAGLSFDPTLAMISYAWATRRLVQRLRSEGATDVVVGFGHSVVQDVYRLGAGTHAEWMEITRQQPAGRGGPVLDRVALLLERARLRADNTPLLVAPSERVKDELIRHYQIDPTRIEVIWNGVDRDRFTPDADPEERAAVRAAWGAGAEEPILLFVGQDPARKGLATAVAVAERLGARLAYVGRARRPRDLSAAVIWDGERRDVERCYRAADLLLLPSRYDPFGGVVLEALASGLPAVATARIGATERMRGTILERLRIEDPEDIESFTAAARWALEESRRRELRAAARALTEGADPGAWGARMEAVLLRAAAQRRAA